MATTTKQLTKGDGQTLMRVVDEATKAALRASGFEAFRFDAGIHVDEGFITLTMKIRQAQPVCEVCEEDVEGVIEGRLGGRKLLACESCWSNAPAEAKPLAPVKA
jgi:hypothetical protein